MAKDLSVLVEETVMNQLSWLLYFAGTLPSLSSALIFVAVVASIIGLGCWVGSVLCLAFEQDAIRRKKESDAAEFLAWKTLWTPWRKLLPIGLVFFLLGQMMPPKETFYAIAASEVGEQVIKSESVRGIADDGTKALQQWIKRQIEPNPSKQ